MTSRRFLKTSRRIPRTSKRIPKTSRRFPKKSRGIPQISKKTLPILYPSESLSPASAFPFPLLDYSLWYPSVLTCILCNSDFNTIIRLFNSHGDTPTGNLMTPMNPANRHCQNFPATIMAFRQLDSKWNSFFFLFCFPAIFRKRTNPY